MILLVRIGYRPLTLEMLAEGGLVMREDMWLNPLKFSNGQMTKKRLRFFFNWFVVIKVVPKGGT